MLATPAAAIAAIHLETRPTSLPLFSSRVPAPPSHNFKRRTCTSPAHCSSSYGQENSRWVSMELERLHSIQKRPGDGLVLTRGQWSWVLQEPNHYQLKGNMEFHNVTKRFEIFIPEVHGKLQLLAGMALDSVFTSIHILPRHPTGKPAPRDDGYWPAYITQAGASTSIEVLLNITSKAGKPLKKLQAAILEIEYISYGPHGRSIHAQHVILPLQYPDAFSSNADWYKIARAGPCVLPIRTHLLSHLDDPLEVLRRYVLPLAKAGDVIAIGETPLAIMQGRFRHPRTVHPGLLAGLACRLFHPTSSLATACGMQALVDIAGRLRVIVAVFIAVIARLFGQRGIFYRVAGQQARLIDDVTGTLPPYDQFITLGPVRVQATVDALRTKAGSPVNTSRFLLPLVEGLGYQYPDRELSVRAAMGLAWFFWGFYGLLYPYLGKDWLPQPFILPAEVYKVGVTHYFSILKARQELSYVPLVDPKEGMRRTISYFKSKQAQEVPSPTFLAFFLSIVGMVATCISAFVPLAFQGPFRFGTRVGIFFFRSIFGIRMVFFLAVTAHVLEATYAWQLARKVDPTNARRWFWQTLAVGYKSLILLHRRAKSWKELKHS